MVLPEVVHRKPDSDQLEVRPSTEGVTSTPPPGLEPHPQGSGEELGGRGESAERAGNLSDDAQSVAAQPSISSAIFDASKVSVVTVKDRHAGSETETSRRQRAAPEATDAQAKPNVSLPREVREGFGTAPSEKDRRDV